MEARKKQRLDDALSLRTRGVSDVGLERIVRKLKAKPEIIQSFTRNARTDVATAVYEQSNTATVELQLPLLTGGSFSWHVLAVDQLMRLFIQKSDAFRMLVADTFAKTGNARPWRGVLYHDEITPGNNLRADNKRRLVCFYFGILEFGLRLRSEFVWLPVAVLRTTQIQAVRGHLSGVLRALLHHLSALSVAGIVLPLQPAQLITVRLDRLLCDESALKQTLDAKGASGLKPCMLCKNIVMRGSGLVNPANAHYLREITEPDNSTFDLFSDQEIWEAIDKLKVDKHALPKYAFDRLEKALGFNLNVDGVLCDVPLRTHFSPTSSRFDSMHCYFSQGIAALELHLFLDACSSHLGIGFDQFERYCSADWSCPAHADRLSPATVFSANRASASKNADSFKGMASEVLAVYPLVRHLAETTVPAGRLTKELASFRCMSDCVEALQRLKRRSVVPAELIQELQELQQKHLRQFLTTYGEDWARPKHHYSLHIPLQLMHDRFLLDCFVLERKHRLVKRQANHVTNTRTYEKSVIARVLAEQLSEMPGSFADGLVGGGEDAPEVAEQLGVPRALVAQRMQFGPLLVACDDVFIADGKAFVVQACVQTDSLLLLVRAFLFSHRQGFGSVWKKDQLAWLVPCETLEQPPYWTYSADDTLLTLRG